MLAPSHDAHAQISAARAARLRADYRATRVERAPIRIRLGLSLISLGLRLSERRVERVRSTA
jgi:hypothetical protein